MHPQIAIRVVIGLLVFEALAPALAARAFSTDPEDAIRAFGVLACVLAFGLWTGRRFAYVLARGYAGVQLVVASYVLLSALVYPRATFYIVDAAHAIPRIVGVTMMCLLAATGWWKWRLLGQSDATALFVRASW